MISFVYTTPELIEPHSMFVGELKVKFAPPDTVNAVLFCTETNFDIEALTTVPGPLTSSDPLTVILPVPVSRFVPPAYHNRGAAPCVVTAPMTAPLPACPMMSEPLRISTVPRCVPAPKRKVDVLLVASI